MAVGDLDTVLAIADRVHPDNPESREALASRLELFPAGCRMLGEVGYGFAHPALLRRPPPLDSVLHALPSMPECLHLHDVAVLPEWRGGGATARYLDILRQIAHQAGLPVLALVSVNGSVPYWSRHGFRPLDPDPDLDRVLASYCGGGTYMTAPVG